MLVLRASGIDPEPADVEPKCTFEPAGGRISASFFIQRNDKSTLPVTQVSITEWSDTDTQPIENVSFLAENATFLSCPGRESISIPVPSGLPKVCRNTETADHS